MSVCPSLFGLFGRSRHSQGPFTHSTNSNHLKVMKQLSYKVPMHCTYITTEAMTTAHVHVQVFCVTIKNQAVRYCSKPILYPPIGGILWHPGIPLWMYCTPVEVRIYYKRTRKRSRGRVFGSVCSQFARLSITFWPVWAYKAFSRALYTLN